MDNTIGNAADGQAAAAPRTPIQFHGTTGGFYRIWLLNLLLTIVTLGVYNFWGRTRLRRYTAAHFEVGGERLEYTGTGGELYRGFLKALPVILVLFYWPQFIFLVGRSAISPGMRILLTYVKFIPIVFFLYVGMYAALRYRLSRTTWRGIRGRLTGSALKYGVLRFKLLLANIFSLGLAIAWSDRIATRFQMEHMWVGDLRGEFGDDAAELRRVHFRTWLLAIPTFGLSRLWYAAAYQRYRLNNFRLAGLAFTADMTGGDMFGLMVINWLIVIVTLGLGRPVTFQRDFMFIAEHVALTGDLENTAAAVAQSTEQRSTSGEGLDGVLDTGLF